MEQAVLWEVKGGNSTLKIKHLHPLKISKSTWQWRTVEGDTGTYLTFANGKGILFQRDDNGFGCKVATMEKFQACKTVSGTRRKLNKLFSSKDKDPSPNDQWRF